MPVSTTWRAAGVRAVAREAAWITLLTSWALFLTWPLATKLGSSVPQDLGDPLENAWILAWGGHAIREQPLALFHANIFHPQRYTLAFAENMLGISVPLAPLFWLTGNALLVTNVAALAVSIAAGYGVAVLVRGRTASVPAAAAAAAAYMAAPYRVSSLSHIHVIAIHLLPFLLLTLLGLARRPTWWRAGLVAALVGAQFWSSLTGGLVTLVAIGCWGVWTLVAHRETAVRAIAFGIAGVALGMCSAVPVVLAYSHARAENPEYAHPEVEVLENSATPGSFLYPPPGGTTSRGLYAALADDFGGRASSEETLFPGFVLTIGGLAGLVAAMTVARWRREASFAVVLALAGALLSFGPRWGGRSGGLPLPFAVVSSLVPGGLTRVPARFGALVLLALAILLGLGVARLPRRAALAVALAAIGLLAVERWPPNQPYVEPPPISPAYELLEGRTGAVLALPTLEYDADGALVVPSVYREARHLYFSTTDFTPRTNGYGAFVPTGYAALAQQIQDFPTEAGLAALRRAGVETVVVERAMTDESRWAGVEERLQEWPSVRLLATAGDTFVFDIADVPVDAPATASG